MRAVVLLSGGLDSSTCVAMATAFGREVHALSFNYGQRHSNELEAAKEIAHHFDVASHTVVTTALRGSSLTSDSGLDLGEDWRRPGVPSSYVPSRNAVFLSHAWSHAEHVGAGEVWIGANAVDYSGYPDCRPEFLWTFERSVNLGTEHQVRLLAPLVDMTKVEIVQSALHLNVPIEKTMSCYQGQRPGCKRCDSCQIREEALEAAGA